jgi:(1->4)-alpha-D-glucan 1-alpha-D-glucosylmutase
MMDIVPNHMGVLGADNDWWQDLLENGPASTLADFFDIDWHPPGEHLANRVLLPVLGDAYGAELSGGKLRLEFDAHAGGFAGALLRASPADRSQPVPAHPRPRRARARGRGRRGGAQGAGAAHP